MIFISPPWDKEIGLNQMKKARYLHALMLPFNEIKILAMPSMGECRVLAWNGTL